MDLSAQALQDFEQDVRAAANARGVELDADTIQAVFNATVASGSFTPLMMRQALDGLLVSSGWDPDQDDFDEDEYEPDDEEDESNPGLERLARDFQSEQARLEDKIGRRLSDAEIDRLSDAALSQAERGYQRIDVVGAFEEREERLNTTAGRHELYRERLGEQAAEDHEERVERMVEGRELDLDDPHDRADYMVARLSGVEFEDG